MSSGFDALFSLLVFSALVLLLRLVVLRPCDPRVEPESTRDETGDPS